MIILLNGNRNIQLRNRGIVVGANMSRRKQGGSIRNHVEPTVNYPLFGTTLTGRIAPKPKTFLVGSSVNSIKFNAKKRSNIKFIQ